MISTGCMQINQDRAKIVCMGAIVEFVLNLPIFEKSTFLIFMIFTGQEKVVMLTTFFRKVVWTLGYI